MFFSPDITCEEEECKEAGVKYCVGGGEELFFEGAGEGERALETCSGQT